jgi:capsular polysaccharide biosynthesis protein
MEIRDYLRAIRRVLWLLILIPVVAGLATGGLMEIQPSTYEADATVVVPAISAAGFSQSAASQYADTFKDVLVSQPVLTEVSQKFTNIPKFTDITTSELASGLSSSTITTSSNIIHVVLIGKDHQNLTGAVREATVDTLNAIAAPRLAQAENAYTNAQARLVTANNNSNTFAEVTQNPDPPVALNSALARLSQLDGILASAQVHNDAGVIASTTALITAEKAELVKLGQQDVQYETLSDALSSARSASDHATQEVVDAQALVTTDSAPGTVTTVNVGRLSKLSNTIKFAGIAFALALVMMLGLLLILELMRSGRRVAVVEAPEQGAFAWNAQTAAPPAPETAGVPAQASAPPAQTAERRDPWRASSTATAPVAVTGGNGNGNGNGHANGNGNGNGHADGTEVEADPQRSGLLRRG